MNGVWAYGKWCVCAREVIFYCRVVVCIVYGFVFWVVDVAVDLNLFYFIFYNIDSYLRLKITHNQIKNSR